MTATLVESPPTAGTSALRARVRERLEEEFLRLCAMDRPALRDEYRIAALAHELGLTVVAEGVETPAQAEQLRDLGVDLAQGFHFGRPARAVEIVRRIDPAAVRSDEWDTSHVLDHDGI